MGVCVCRRERWWCSEGEGGVIGENPLWAEASAGLHLTQHSARREKSRKFPSACLILQRKYLLAVEEFN